MRSFKYILTFITILMVTTLSAQTYYVLDESAEVKIGLYGEKTYSYGGYGGSLSFDARKGGYTTGPLRIDQYINGEWVTGVLSIGNGSLSSSSFKSFSCSLDARATKVRFYNEGSLNKVFKNVKITMATYADAPTTTSWNPTAVIGSADETASTTMEWCNTSAFALSLSGDGASQFTYSISNNASAGNYGTATITATYKHNVAGTHKATLTITTAFGSHKIELTGTTTKKTQTIAWAEALSGSDIALPMGKIITPPANAQTGITYSVADPTIISINGNTLTALKAGTTTITATAVENEEWLSATSTITVKVTEKKVQYIHWNDNLTRLKVGGDSVLLTATAWVLKDPKTETQEENPERTPYITYASANNNIVSVSGNVLTIKGEGETILTATLPGDDVYEGVVVSTPVHVRAVSTSVCEAYVLDDSKTRTLNTIDDEEYTINGPADKLTFSANREKLLGVSNNDPIYVDQYYDGGWHSVFETSVALNNYTSYGPIQLNRKASKVKFYTKTGATGYRNIKDVAVTMATYLETTTPEIVVERSIIGAIIDETIRIQYSNLPDDVPVVNNSDKITVKESGLGNVCGEYGEKELHLTIRPTEIGVIEDTITIHDEATGKKLEIPVTVHTQRNTQTIVWEQDLANINTTDNITLTASAKTAIHYLSSDSTIAYVEADVLKINKHGQVTITAVATQDEKYEQATASKDITIVESNRTPTFVGGGVDNSWTTPTNWNLNRVPNAEDSVIINAPVEITDGAVEVLGMTINAGGAIHITPTGGLTVGEGGIAGVAANNITIDNNTQGVGFLRINPDAKSIPTNVTINYTTRGKSGNPRDEVWQYIGAPGANMSMTNEGVLIYHWSEQNGWVKATTAMAPFVGYAISRTTTGNDTYTITTTPVLDNHTIELTRTPRGMDGSNLFVNSYLAPIDLAKFELGVDIVGNVEQTFYLFNSGSWNDWQNDGGGDESIVNGTSPGQYFAITPGSAALLDASMDQTTIPPMQGVYVVANESATIHLNYNKHVFTSTSADMNRPMRAPQQQDQNFMRVRIQVNSDNSGADRMYVIQHENATKGYDNGYDAKNILADGQANIYTHEQDGQMEISVTNQLDSTYIGFAAGDDAVYTLTFTSLVGEEMYLYDIEQDILIPLAEQEQYTFYAQPNSVNNQRFILLLNPDDAGNISGGDGVATDIENLSASSHIWFSGKTLHVADAPANTTLAIYSACGMCIMAPNVIPSVPYALDLSHLPMGVYVLRLNDQAYKFVCK